MTERTDTPTYEQASQAHRRMGEINTALGRGDLADADKRRAALAELRECARIADTWQAAEDDRNADKLDAAAAELLERADDPRLPRESRHVLIAEASRCSERATNYRGVARATRARWIDRDVIAQAIKIVFEE